MNTPVRGRSTNRPGARSTRGRPVRGGAADPRWRRVLPPVLLGVITVVVLVLYFTPLLAVRAVEVEGNRRLGDEEVLAAAGVELGTPLLRVDTGDISAHLGEMAALESANVELRWPSTVRLDVVERVPVAFVVGSGGAHLVDASGVPFTEVPEPPPGLPELEVRAVSPEDPAARAALSALTALDPVVREQVVAVEAARPSDVRLLLTGGREVHWGMAEESERKAAILPPLLSRPGEVYDVTSPELPTVA